MYCERTEYSRFSNCLVIFFFTICFFFSIDIHFISFQSLTELLGGVGGSEKWVAKETAGAEQEGA